MIIAIAAFGLLMVLGTFHDAWTIPGAPAADGMPAEASGSTRSQTADAARWTALGEAHSRAKASATETARWQARADAHARLRAATADAARWQARADHFLETDLRNPPGEAVAPVSVPAWADRGGGQG